MKLPRGTFGRLGIDGWLVEYGQVRLFVASEPRALGRGIFVEVDGEKVRAIGRADAEQLALRLAAVAEHGGRKPKRARRR